MLELDCAHELACPELEPINRLCRIVLNEDVLDAHALRRRRNFTQTVWIGLVAGRLPGNTTVPESDVPDDSLRGRVGVVSNDLRV